MALLIHTHIVLYIMYKYSLLYCCFIWFYTVLYLLLCIKDTPFSNMKLYRQGHARVSRYELLMLWRRLDADGSGEAKL